MTVTVEVINQGSLSLLRSMESIGLIQVTPLVSHDTGKIDQKENKPNRWLRGCCQDHLPRGSVENFLAECRADKEMEFAREEREKAERARYARIPS